MKKITELSKLYLKLAQASEQISFNEYDAAWNELMKSGYPNYAEFASKYYKFLQEDPDAVKRLVQDALEYDDSLGDGRYWTNARKLIRTLEEKAPQTVSLVKQILIELCENKPNFFSIRDLLSFENIFTKTELQNFIIKKIKQITVDPEDPRLNTRLTNFLVIFLNSQKIHPEVIARLLRQINPDRFARYYEGGPSAAEGGSGGLTEDERHDFFKNFFYKDKYTTDDIMWLIEKLKTPRAYTDRSFGVDYQRLRRVIDRATPAAQNYLRRALFRISKNNYFILDESMQPMGLDFKNITVQPNERIAIVQGFLTDQMNEKWSNMFIDYKIIPIEGTFGNWGK